MIKMTPVKQRDGGNSVKETRVKINKTFDTSFSMANNDQLVMPYINEGGSLSPLKMPNSLINQSFQAVKAGKNKMKL